MAEERLKLPGHRKLYVLGVVGRQYFGKLKDVDMDGSFRYTGSETDHAPGQIDFRDNGGRISERGAG